MKLEQLKSLELPPDEFERQRSDVLAKECLCVGLSNSASLIYPAPFLKKLNSVTICPGPNIQYFTRRVTLQEMTDHIYGRSNLIEKERPHMFVNELKIYVDYLRELTAVSNPDTKQISYILKFSQNLLEGISYYKSISGEIDEPDFIDGITLYENLIQSSVENFQPAKV